MKNFISIRTLLAAFLLLTVSVAPTSKVSAQPLCQAMYTFVGGQSTPNGYQVSFYDSSWSAGTIVGWQWTFGDGTASTLQNPVHTYTGSGTYVVCLTISSFINNQACTSTYCDTIVSSGTSGNCWADFSAVPDTNGVNMVYFTNLSQAGAGAYYLWNFGDGTTSTQANPVHTYNGPGTYNVCLTVGDSSGCSNTFCSSVIVGTVTPSCNASFSTSVNGLTATFNNLSTNVGPNPDYYWTFGDGGTSWLANPSHIYNVSGTYQVCLTLIDSSTGCADIYCANVSVQGGGSTCQASFFYTVSPSGLVAFTNNSTGNITINNWSFGDGTGSSVANPTHTYNGPGTYIVCLTVANNNTGCQSTFCDSVVISGCSSNFAIYPDSLLQHTYYGYNLAYGAAPLTYLWSWGDSTYSNVAYPSHTYSGPGLYTICLTITDATGCSSTTCYSWQLLRMAGGAPVTINIINTTTGLPGINIEEGTLTVAPNPVADLLNVHLVNPTNSTASLSIYDIEGRLVKDLGANSGSELNLSFDVTGLKSGLYFLKLTAGSWQEYQKVMIK